MRTVKLKPIELRTDENNKVVGLNLEKDLTFEQVKYIIENIFHILIDNDLGKDYDKELTETFNNWLKGNNDGDFLMYTVSNLDYISPKHIVLLLEYLQK